VTVWYLLNELLSIVENAGRMGAPVPDWLAKYIAMLKNKIDTQGGEKV
ncbi:phage holin family protein, partial [Bacteroides congonensis]